MRSRASARSRAAARLAGVVGVLLMAGVAIVTVVLVSQAAAERPFEAEVFRDAGLTRDAETLQTQARLAVDQSALIGMSSEQLRATLGTPTRRYKRSARMVWEVGGWNWSGSLGATLQVKLDRDRQRAVAAWLDLPPADYD